MSVQVLESGPASPEAIKLNKHINLLWQALATTPSKVGWCMSFRGWCGSGDDRLLPCGFPPEVSQYSAKTLASCSRADASVQAFHFLHKVRFVGPLEPAQPDKDPSSMSSARDDNAGNAVTKLKYWNASMNLAVVDLD